MTEDDDDTQHIALGFLAELLKECEGDLNKAREVLQIVQAGVAMLLEDQH